MSVPLQEDEHEALLELAVVGPVQSGRFEHPSVTAATEGRLLQAGFARLEAGAFVLTPEGAQTIRRDSAFRTRGFRVIDSR